MAKSTAGTAGYHCTECGWQSAKWSGRCGECQAWGTVQQRGTSRAARSWGSGASGGFGGSGGSGASGGGVRAVSYRFAAPVSTPAMPIGQVDATDAGARPTGLDELDRVLGGGLVPGAVLLLAGEPGVGKATLLLEAGAPGAGARAPRCITRGGGAAPGGAGG